MKYATSFAVLFATCILIWVPGVFAQDRAEIRPGFDALDTTPIRAGSDSLAIFYFAGEDVFAIGTYVLDTSIHDGRIVRIERMLGLEDELLWGEEQVVEDHSIAPISISAIGDRADHLTVDGMVAARRWVDDEGEQQVRVTMEAPAFYSNSLDLVLRSLPLEEGYAATLVVLDAQSLAEVLIPITVARAVALADATGTQRRTWEVHVDLDGAIDVYHLEHDTHDLIRYESAMEGLVMLKW